MTKNFFHSLLFSWWLRVPLKQETNIKSFSFFIPWVWQLFAISFQLYKISIHRSIHSLALPLHPFLYRYFSSRLSLCGLVTFLPLFFSLALPLSRTNHCKFAPKIVNSANKFNDSDHHWVFICYWFAALNGTKRIWMLYVDLWNNV